MIAVSSPNDLVWFSGPVHCSVRVALYILSIRRTWHANTARGRTCPGVARKSPSIPSPPLDLSRVPPSCDARVAWKPSLLPCVCTLQSPNRRRYSRSSDLISSQDCFACFTRLELFHVTASVMCQSSLDMVVFYYLSCLTREVVGKSFSSLEL